ncbi:MAG: bifunctional 4-hydroxy-2-oxoglutarate aldolase/2-dehydro-3-deoxy-phosphogluconate aldolase [Sulfuricella sp.]|jgi:2-dehydro-3-deoxyphosphogluconate aldolase/(4S)-4-hydroxy-2-oxoglutarate aldolase
MALIRKWKMQPGEVFAQGPVVPVMVIKDLAHAVPLARALVAGGIRVLEITLRTPVAVEAIREIAQSVPEAVVGAGTVTSADDLAAVSAAGAVFAISPGLTPELLDGANQGPIALIPGIATVSELMTGLQRGYDHFKFFPAEAAGGIPMLKAIAGPFPKVVFCPTGGIGLGNYREYLALGNVACVGGSWVAPAEAVARGDWGLISQLARDAVLGAGK